MKIDWPAWLQAVGALAALFLAVWLPERDRWRARENYREAAWVAAQMAYRSIAGAWVIALGKTPVPTDPESMLDPLDRSVIELESFPLLNSSSISAVAHMRELAQCARGAATAIRAKEIDFAARMWAISNYAHHLLILVARELKRPEPPPPDDSLGVPPAVAAEVRRPAPRGRRRTERG